MQVRMIFGTKVGHHIHHANTTPVLEDEVAQALITLGRAEPFAEPGAIKAREPKVETRDPKAETKKTR